MMPPPESGSGGGQPDEGHRDDETKPNGPEPPADEHTQEHELGDDFQADSDEQAAEAPEPTGEHEPPPEEPEEGDEAAAAADADEAAEDELTQVIRAETHEWDGLEAAERQGEAEKTFVQSARSKVTSGFEAVGGERVSSGFKAVGRRIRFPLWARFLTAAFVIVLSVGTATAASLLLYIEGIADDLKLDPEFEGIQKKLEGVEAGEPQTILILGSDKRPEFKKDSFRGLSDTTMLLRVDPDRNAVALFSLPRDLAVDIPGYGRTKLNEAYANGGPELTLQTIQDLTKVPATDNQGLEVNHVVNIDFEGFARAVNEIGCVYVDVDRRYFHSNDETVQDYEEIDIQPGYQALCGFNALDYARYRYTDNDVVRAARQQDFLREARQKVPPEVVFADRKELIDIFTEHTTSDIDNAAEMLEVLKLFIEARDAPIKEVHFEGELGPSFVTTTPEQINKAVAQFLGIEDTPGQRAQTAAPDDPGSIAPESAPDDSGATQAASAKARKKKNGGGGGGGSAQLVESSFGKELAKSIRARKVKLPVYYPTILEAGTDYAQKPRVYKVNGTGAGSPPNSERAAYKWVFSRPALGEYYGFMATRWQDPPILKNPSEEREIDGREYKLFYDGDRLKLVAWQTDEGSFWVHNTLIQSLSDREMIDIAKGMTELPRRGARD